MKYARRAGWGLYADNCLVGVQSVAGWREEDGEGQRYLSEDGEEHSYSEAKEESCREPAQLGEKRHKADAPLLDQARAGILLSGRISKHALGVQMALMARKEVQKGY